MEEKLDKFIEEQASALKLLYEKKKIMPFLMLFYTNIDVFGYFSGKGVIA